MPRTGSTLTLETYVTSATSKLPLLAALVATYTPNVQIRTTIQRVGRRLLPLRGKKVTSPHRPPPGSSLGEARPLPAGVGLLPCPNPPLSACGWTPASSRCPPQGGRGPRVPVHASPAPPSARRRRDAPPPRCCPRRGSRPLATPSSRVRPPRPTPSCARSDPRRGSPRRRNCAPPAPGTRVSS